MTDITVNEHIHRLSLQYPGQMGSLVQNPRQICEQYERICAEMDDYGQEPGKFTIIQAYLARDMVYNGDEKVHDHIANLLGKLIGQNADHQGWLRNNNITNLLEFYQTLEMSDLSCIGW